MIKKSVSTPRTRAKKSDENVPEQQKSNVDLTTLIRVELKHKNETQKKLTQSIKNSDVTICTGPAGTGKAQPLDAIVYTPSGYKSMGEIKIDDYVITQDGSPTKVIGVFPQGEKEIFRVEFNDGSSTEVCKEHLWLTQTINDRNYQKRVRNEDGIRKRIGLKGKEGSVKTTEEIMTSLYLGKHTNHSIPITEPVNFNNINVEIHPYILGGLLGDGGLTSCISFSSIDVEIIDKIESLLPISMGINKNIGSNCDYRLVKNDNTKQYRNEFKTYLTEMKLMGLKSNEKHIPNEYLYNSVINRIELLQGLMDTDGYVSKDGTCVEYYTTSEQLSKDVKILVESLGGVVRVRTRVPKFNYNGLKKEGLLCFTLNISLPHNINPFYVSRKRNLVKSKTKYPPKRFITNISSVGVKEAQCIMVEDESRLYLTDNFIVTHNTYLSCLQALTELKNNENIKKIVLVKSVTTLKSEEIGFLKGTMEEKMEPFMYSFTGNFEKLIGKELFTKLKTSNQIEILPIAYLRGVNIDNAIVIIDEVQNITIENIRTILTRLGENSKMIFLGDIKQIDAKNKYDSALSFLLTHFKGIDRIGIVEFGKEDIIRHPLIKVIEDIFDKVEESKKIEQPKQIKQQTIQIQKNIKEKSLIQKFLTLFK